MRTFMYGVYIFTCITAAVTCEYVIGSATFWFLAAMFLLFYVTGLLATKQ